jgi:hypothetical protein
MKNIQQRQRRDETSRRTGHNFILLPGKGKSLAPVLCRLVGCLVCCLGLLWCDVLRCVILCKVTCCVVIFCVVLCGVVWCSMV